MLERSEMINGTTFRRQREGGGDSISKRHWRVADWSQCPCCGGTVEVLTESDGEHLFDGDRVRCFGEDEDCDAQGLHVVVDDEGVYIEGVVISPERSK